MLKVDIAVVDGNGRHTVARIVIKRQEQHPKLKRAYWYEYGHMDDQGQGYRGRVMHSYDNGAVALVQKVSKAIVKQAKERKQNAK